MATTVNDLGRLVKAKYPGSYDDMTDDAVGAAVKTKYPGSYDDFTSGPPKVSAWDTVKNAAGAVKDAAMTPLGGGSLVENYSRGMNAPGGVKDLATRAVDAVGGRGTTGTILRDVPALKWVGSAADEAVRAGLGAVDFVRSPAGVATALSGGAPAAVRAGAGALFATDMAPGAAQAVQEAWRDPNSSTIPHAVATVAMTAAPLAHAYSRTGPPPVVQGDASMKAEGPTVRAPADAQGLRMMAQAEQQPAKRAVYEQRLREAGEEPVARPAVQRPARESAAALRETPDYYEMMNQDPPPAARPGPPPVKVPGVYDERRRIAQVAGGQDYEQLSGEDRGAVDELARGRQQEAKTARVAEGQEPVSAPEPGPHPSWPPALDLGAGRAEVAPERLEPTPMAAERTAQVERQPEKVAPEPEPQPSTAAESAGVFQKAGPTYAELFDRLDKASREASDRLRQKGVYDGSNLGMGGSFDVATLKDIAVSIAGDLARGVDSAAELVKRYGEAIRPHVERVIEMAREHARTMGGAAIAAPDRTRSLERRTVSGEVMRPTFNDIYYDRGIDYSKTPPTRTIVLMREAPTTKNLFYEVINKRGESVGKFKSRDQAVRVASDPDAASTPVPFASGNKTLDVRASGSASLGVTVPRPRFEDAPTVQASGELRRAIGPAADVEGKPPAPAGGVGVSATPEAQPLGDQSSPRTLTDLLKNEEGFQPNAQDLADAWHRVSRKITEEGIDRYVSLKALAEHARENIPGLNLPANITATRKARLPFNENPYFGARLFAGAGGKAENRLNQFGVILRSAKKDGLMDATKNYALYERYEELAGRGVDKFPNGQTLSMIQRDKRALETTLGPANLRKVQGYADQVRSYSNTLLREAYRGGLISPEGYRAILASNQKYVPLQRMAFLADEIAKNEGFQSNAMSVRSQDLINSLSKEGSTREIVDPFTAMIKNTYKAVSLIERNKVARQVADLSRRPEFAGVVTRLNPGHSVPPGMETMSVLRQGAREDYVVPRDVGRALKNMNAQSVDLVTKTASLLSRGLRAGATSLNVAFLASNVVRDYQTATAVSRVGFTPADWAKGLWVAARRGPLYEQYLESGAAMSGYFQGARSLPGKVGELTEGTGMKVAKAMLPWNTIRHLGELTELAPRLGVFQKSLAQGLPLEEAGLNARNATVDFSKAGNTMRVLNMWVPFLNARLQGNVNLFESMKPGEVASRQMWGKQRSPQMVAGWNAMKLGLMVGIPAIATYMYNHRDPEIAAVWDNISDFEKRGNFIVITGTEKDDQGYYTQVIKVPKGDVKAFANPVENFLDYMKGHDPKSLSQLGVEVASDLSPVDFETKGKVDAGTAAASLMPPTMKGAAEGISNKNFFTGRDIVPEYYHGTELRKASPEQQYTDRTSKAAVKIGGALGASPMKVENFAGTQFGGVGKQFMAAAGSQKKPSGTGSVGETIKRRYIGARADDEKAMKDLGAIEQGRADSKVVVARDAEGIADQLDKMKPDEAIRYVQGMIASGKMDDTLQDAVQKSIEGRAAGLTPVERTLKSRPLEVRAQFIAQQLQRTKSLDEQIKIVERYTEKGVLTGAVEDMVAQILAAQPAPGTGPPPVRAAR